MLLGSYGSLTAVKRAPCERKPRPERLTLEKRRGFSLPLQENPVPEVGSGLTKFPCMDVGAGFLCLDVVGLRSTCRVPVGGGCLVSGWWGPGCGLGEAGPQEEVRGCPPSSMGIGHGDVL